MGTNIKRSDDELKHELYAVLFSSGKRMLLADLARLVRCRDHDRILKLLGELKKDLVEQQGPVVLMQDNQDFKLQVRTKFIDLVQKVCKQTELPKSMLETLAVVAYKTPVLQSDIIRIRTNKAYAHLEELEKQGYITREPYGRTRLVRATQKFYEYFEISPEELQKHIAKRNIQEEGEQQQKITTLMDRAGDLEVYHDKKGETVQRYSSETQSDKGDSKLDTEPVDEAGTLFENETDSKIDESTLESADSTTPSLDNIEHTDTDIEKVDVDKAQEQDRTETENNVSSNHRKPSAHKTPPAKDESEAEQQEEDYEPPKVKGGFKKFSSEEKKKIKDRSEEITGEDSDEQP